MLLSEAKEILKKNGYKLVEAYDAVTAHRNEKGADNKDSYYPSALIRLQNALAEEGIESRVGSTLSGERNSFKNVLVFGKYRVTLYNVDTVFSPVDGYVENNHAGYSEMENGVTLRLFADWKLVDEADFDPRNTPSMVKWILAKVKR